MTEEERMLIVPAITSEAQFHIVGEITDERALQDAKWGGAAHDDKHTPYDWHRFIVEHASKAIAVLPAADLRSLPPVAQRAYITEYRRHMIEVAALAVAAIESLDRKYPRDEESGE